MHQLGAILALIVMGIGALVLTALGLMMMIGAIAPKRSEITSWPQQQEGMFQPFNERAAGSQSQAWMIGIIISVVVFIFTVGVKFGVPPDIREVKGMNMSNLTKKEDKAAPAPAPKKEEPKAEEKKEAPAEAPKAEEPKKEEKK